MNEITNYQYCKVLILCLCASCSTTANLPKGEILYTGIKEVKYLDEDSIDVDDNLYDLVEEAFACPPNNALSGSSRARTPFAVGLWVYNANVNKNGSVNKLLMKWLAKNPVLISTVNPTLRTRIVTHILHENGYLAGKADYVIIPDKKDTLKARIRYEVTFNQPYLIDSIEYRRMQNRSDTLLQLQTAARLLHRGDIFSTSLLEAERQRIADLIRNNGYYYFLPENIVYQADSTLSPQQVSLKIGLKQGVSRSILKPWKIGNITVALYGYDNETPTDTINYQDINILYEGKLRIKPKTLYEQFKFHSGELYSLDKQRKTQNAINRLDIFRYSGFEYTPADTVNNNDTLNVLINTAYNYPYNVSADLRGTYNDNNFAGPKTSLSLTQRNVFRGGESLTATLLGSYEFYTGKDYRSNTGLINNYEIGVLGSLTFPRLVFPRKTSGNIDAFTRIDLSVSSLNRTKYYSMLSFGGKLTYEFVPNPIRLYSFTPLSLVFNKLQSTTERFDSIIEYNPSLYQSMQDRFIPSMEYSYTLNNTPVRTERSKTVWRISISEAGNLISGAYALFGRGFKEKKKILGNTYSQFVKITTELRYNHYISRNHRLATRIGGGIIYSYGNSTVSPYNERFYVGGANSIRAFTIRSLGPGRFTPNRNNPYAYIDQNGDFKLEGNAEYRYKLVGNLQTAVFLDAGNVWLLRDDPARPDGMFVWKHLFNDIALGTGIGLRYDMQMLVFRFDVGYALHFPYDTGVSGYFNAPSLRNALGFHLALGYPF
ncbi:MAG: BamA/TamA family outer membrane protein [Tannerella sp.]|nr:BamA/TamA family outer membrane protein [Tannerella sp.]